MTAKDILSLLQQQAEQSPSAVALKTIEGQSLTYRDLLDKADRLAGQIEAAAPRRTAERARTALIMPNGISLCVALLSSALAGEVAPFNPLYTEEEFKSLFALAKIDRVLVRDDYAGAALRAAEVSGIPVIRLASDLTIAGHARGSYQAPLPEHIALILMTSGSTGKPKIVPLSHRNICRSAQDVSLSVRLGPDDLCLSMWEQYHIGGLVDLLLAPLSSGGTILVAGSFNAPLFFDLVKKFHPTWFQAVPTSLIDLLEYAERRKDRLDFSSLRFVRAVAAPLTPAHMSRLEHLFKAPIIRTLGMTEAGPLITSTALPPAPQKPGSVGRPAGPEVAILDAEGKDVSQGITGEVAVRGENVFGGYENNEDANALSFKGGWFLTGDLGYFDADGDLFLTGRSKEQINRGGFKISPNEVEAVIATHPSIKEVAIFGVQHPTLSEDVVAAISTSAPLSPSDLRLFLKDHLAPFKIPTQILVLDALPRNPVGKVDKMALALIAEKRKTEHFVAPRGALELLIATLWSRELYQPAISRDIEFVSIGGDSLSAMRIILALEAIFKRKIPDDIVESSQTISRFAKSLTEAGFHLPESVTEEDAITLAKQAVETINFGADDFADGWKNSVTAVEEASTVSRLKAALEFVTAYETPSQILSSIPKLRQAIPGHSRRTSVFDFSRFTLRFAYRRLLNQLEREIQAMPAFAAWQRTSYSDTVQLYSADAESGRNKTLIVGYTGNFQRLMMPTYRFLSALDPDRYDLLLLRDPEKKLFSQGLPGIGSTPVEVGAYIDAIAKKRRSQRVIALGTSGGAFAALLGALHNHWSAGISVSSPSLSAHADYKAMLAPFSHNVTDGTTRLFIVNGHHDIDGPAGIELARFLTPSHHEVLQEYTSHNILHAAYLDGRLRQLFDHWFA